ncbi:MAG TPA: SCO family protein, partial [Leptospiraceae bacterium]|nr:SCO family protein [Leptospiraceae bacterium]
MNKIFSGLRIALFAACWFCVSLYAYDPEHTAADNKLPKEIELLKPVNEIGQKVNLDLEFLNEQGKPVRLKEIFSKGKPVIISMVYYKCPTLCNFHLSTVLNTFKGLDWAVGDK